MKITDVAIRGAIVKAKRSGKRAFLACGGGLRLLIEPTGIGRWQLRYRYGGKERTVSFGSYPEVTLAEAMDKALDARKLVRNSIDPVAQRRAEKQALRINVENTFGALAEAWYEHNAPRWSKSTTGKARQYLDKDILPSLRTRPIASLTPVDMGKVIAKIEARGAYNVAKKARQWCKAIFRYAIARGLSKENPAEHLSAIAARGEEPKKYAHLSQEEIPALLRALDTYSGSPLTLGAIRLALWTGNRPGVVRSLKWSEVDLDQKIWAIPKGRPGMKRGYSHVTPLPAQAVTMLRDLQRITGNFEHVFIGRNDPDKPLSDQAMAKALEKMGFKGRQTPHGFRHLVSTALNERGYNKDWIERQLAHGDPDGDNIRGTYNEAIYLEPRRKMMQAWADELDELKDGSN